MSYVALVEIIPIALSGLGAAIAALSLRRRSKAELDYIKNLSEQMNAEEFKSLISSLKAEMESANGPSDNLLEKYLELSRGAISKLPDPEKINIQDALLQASNRGKYSYIYDSLIEVEEQLARREGAANK